MKHVEWNFEISPEKIFEFYQNPPVADKYDMQWKQPDEEKIIKFMVDEHEFSLDRIQKVIERLQQSSKSGKQASLKGFLGK